MRRANNFHSWQEICKREHIYATFNSVVLCLSVEAGPCRGCQVVITVATRTVQEPHAFVGARVTVVPRTHGLVVSIRRRVISRRMGVLVRVMFAQVHNIHRANERTRVLSCTRVQASLYAIHVITKSTLTPDQQSRIIRQINKAG